MGDVEARQPERRERDGAEHGDRGAERELPPDERRAGREVDAGERRKGHPGLQAERSAEHRGCLVLGEDAGAHQRAQGDRLPRAGEPRMADRVVGRRSLDQPGEQARLRRIEPARPDAEVPLARRPGAVGALAEVRAVQVGREDLLLRVPAFELQGERRVLELAPGRVVVPVQVEELADLLGDRARPLRERQVRHVVRKRPEHADDVDSVVVVEPLVLGRDDRVAEDRGERGQADRPRARALQARLHAPVQAGRGRARIQAATAVAATATPAAAATTSARRPIGRAANRIVGLASAPLAEDAGVAERVAAGLRPDAEAVRPGSDGIRARSRPVVVEIA